MDSPLIRVACVGYTNAWPLTRHLDPTRFDVVPCVPSEAARLLRSGEADVGLIPVGALLTDGDWRVVPGLAIGCDGDVASVLLVGERPLEEWDAVALDGESRTSVLLAQILLRGPLGRPDVRVYPVDAGTGAFHAQGRTGAVVIGDAARNLPDRLTHRIDLGRVWKDWTGLPFVFAVWAGRRDLPEGAIEGLKRAAERGLAERDSAPPADRYYLTENIRYELDDRALMGLRRFAALGRAAGLLVREDVSLYGPTAEPRARVSVDSILERAVNGERLSAEDAGLLAEHATLTELGMAAHLRRLALHPGREVGFEVEPADGARPQRPTASVRPGDLFALRSIQDAHKAVDSMLVDGRGMSANAWLRATALARLVLDNVPHVAADPASQGPEVAQMSLHLGADDYGFVSLANVGDAEHHIKTAGFTPVPRGGLPAAAAAPQATV